MKKLNKTRSELLARALNNWEAHDRRNFNIYRSDDIFADEQELSFRINWSAIGDTSPADTLNFAVGLTRAAMFCERVHALHVICDRSDDEVLCRDRALYESVCDEVYRLVNAEDYDGLYDWIVRSIAD